MNSKWNDIIQAINQGKNFVIFTHANMDGDALGSSSALCCALRRMGKQAVILTENEVPRYLNIIKKADYFRRTPDFDRYTAIAVDCSEESRIEKLSEYFRKAELRLCIDHHVSKGNFAEFSVVEPEAAAAAMLVYDLLKTMEIPLDKELAEFLYVAISTDTGCFKYDTADAKVHGVISELLCAGIDHSRLCNALYSTFPLSQLKLEGIALEHACVFADGKAVISYVTAEDIAKAGSSYEEADTCIDRIRCIEGTEIACMIKEKESGLLKVSLRSKSYADVHKAAEALGGGGHKMASGCTLEGSVFEAIEKLKLEIRKVL